MIKSNKQISQNKCYVQEHDLIDSSLHRILSYVYEEKKIQFEKCIIEGFKVEMDINDRYLKNVCCFRLKDDFTVSVFERYSVNIIKNLRSYCLW